MKRTKAHVWLSILIFLLFAAGCSAAPQAAQPTAISTSVVPATGGTATSAAPTSAATTAAATAAATQPAATAVTPADTATVAATAAATVAATSAQAQVTQSAINCTSPAALTPAETEGPYFKAGSPETTDLYQSGMAGTKLTLSGYVLTADCKPVANAVLDFWQANAQGQYDNSGYTLRGHQVTDANGHYQLVTVIPGLYPGRTEHIHVKVQPPNGQVLTTQLYFPGVAQNQEDGIFDPRMLLNLQNGTDGKLATFNFVVQ